jgi:hypothetical protein
VPLGSSYSIGSWLILLDTLGMDVPGKDPLPADKDESIAGGVVALYMKGDGSSSMGSLPSITPLKLSRLSGASRNLSGESCSPLIVFAGKLSSGGSTDMASPLVVFAGKLPSGGSTNMASSGNGGNVLDMVEKEK